MHKYSALILALTVSKSIHTVYKVSCYTITILMVKMVIKSDQFYPRSDNLGVSFCVGCIVWLYLNITVTGITHPALLLSHEGVVRFSLFMMFIIDVVVVVSVLVCWIVVELNRSILAWWVWLHWRTLFSFAYHTAADNNGYQQHRAE